MKEERVQPVTAAITLHRLYCSQALFRHDLVPRDDNPPRPDRDLEVQFNLGLEQDDDHPERLGVIIRTVLEPDPDKNQPYYVDVGYRGDFLLDDELRGRDKRRIAMTTCAAILYPYVRQTVSDLTSRGTNGPILLPTINVAMMLQAAEEAEGAVAGQVDE